MRMTAVCAVILAAAVCSAAVEVRWTAETSRPKAETIVSYRGDTLDLACHLVSYGQPISGTGKEAAFLWQTNGMGEVWWRTNATITADGVISAKWTPSMNPGSDRIVFFMPVTDSAGANFRAAGEIRFRYSPEEDPPLAHLPPPRERIDFSKYEIINPPWETITADMKPTAIYTPDGQTWTDATGCVWRVEMMDCWILTHWRSTDVNIRLEGGGGRWAGGNIGWMGGPIELYYYEKYNVWVMTDGPIVFDVQGTSTDTYLESRPDKNGEYFTAVRMDCPVATNLVTRLANTNELGEVREKMDVSAGEIEKLKSESTLIYRLFSGSNIVMEVTNYNSKVNPPAMKLMRLNDTGEYETMWTETNGLERTYQRAVSNTAEKVAEVAGRFAPRAWSKTTSGLGADAPVGTTWISTPTTVIAGGFEYSKVITSSGQLWFLRSNGMVANVGGNSGGYFDISASDGTSVFSIEKTDSYMAPVDSDGISVNGNTVTIRLSVVSADHPFLRYTPTLNTPVAWQKEEEGFSSPIAVSWSGSSGAWVATVTTTASGGFFQFEFFQEGGVKIKNGGAMDVSSGGILCTDGIHKVRPVYSGGTVTWEAF